MAIELSIKKMLPNDYSYCLNHNCPVRDNCDRYQSAITTTNNNMWISDFKPDSTGKCADYIPLARSKP
jgi:hypothetical protein